MGIFRWMMPRLVEIIIERNIPTVVIDPVNHTYMFFSLKRMESSCFQQTKTFEQAELTKLY